MLETVQCRFRAAAVLLAWCIAAATAGAADWPHWRGPDRNDTTAEDSGWDRGAWPLGDPAWTAQVGIGGTSPIVAGGHVYVMGWSEGAETVLSLDAATGREVWRQSYACPEHPRYHKGDESLYGGPSSTPEFDAETGYLYTLSTDGDLNCWDTGDGGRRVWGGNLYDQYGVPRRPNVGGDQRDYGYVTSPLVYGDWLIVEVGSGQGTLLAYDKRTGAGAWASECTDPAGHCAGMVLMDVGGVSCVGTLTLHRFLLARLDPGHEGETLATWDWQTDFANAIPSPAVAGESVILSAGYNTSRTERVRFTPAGPELVWKITGRFTKVCSPVVYNDCVYFAWQKLRCFDLATGQQRWEGGSFGDDASCLVTADGRIIVFGHKRIVLAESADRSPDAYTELSARAGAGSGYCWPHLAMAEGRIYVKDAKGSLMCYGLGQG